MSNEEITQHQFPTKILMSFTLSSFALGLMMNILLVWMPFYYETVVGFPTILYFIGFTIFTVWDAFNELIAGVLTDKTYSFTKRWGKRFPWVFFSSIFFGVVSIFVFLPPDASIADGWVTFIFFIVILFFYDGLLALWTVSTGALRSDKFRSDADRRKIGAFQTVFGTIGGVMGAVTGGIFIGLFGGLASPIAYVLTMGLFAVIGTIIAVLALPGAKDNQEALGREIVLAETGRSGWGEIRYFFKVMGNGFKNSNFRAWIVYIVANSVYGAIFAPSLTYFVVVVLKYDPLAAGGIVTLLSLPFTLAGILLIPLFLYLVKKYGHLRMFKSALILWPICLIPFLIVSDIISALIVGAILGAVSGLIGVSSVPVSCDLIDEGSVYEETRIDAKYSAIIMFISQLGQVVFAASIFLIHDVFTDYDPALGSAQSPLAVFGIRAQIAIVPIIFLVIAVIYFFLQWKLDPEKVLEIKAKLKELKL